MIHIVVKSRYFSIRRYQALMMNKTSIFANFITFHCVVFKGASFKVLHPYKKNNSFINKTSRILNNLMMNIPPENHFMK